MDFLNADESIRKHYEKIHALLNNVKNILPYNLHDHIITVRDYLSLYHEKPEEIYVYKGLKVTYFFLICPSFVHREGTQIRMGMDIIPTHEAFCLKRFTIHVESSDDSDSDNDDSEEKGFV